MNNWLPENSIVDSEVAVMAKKKAIVEFNIIEHETDVFYVTMKLHHWRDGILHLATRRLRDEPRMFMNLGRLVTHIREKYESITEIKLLLLPVEETTVAKAPKKPAATKPAVKSEGKKPVAKAKTVK